jgi:hypothetical protein
VFLLEVSGTLGVDGTKYTGQLLSDPGGPISSAIIETLGTTGDFLFRAATW